MHQQFVIESEMCGRDCSIGVISDETWHHGDDDANKSLVLGCAIFDEVDEYAILQHHGQGCKKQ